jgi:hypothetical protein
VRVGQGKEGFFFEKKNQKTFTRLAPCRSGERGAISWMTSFRSATISETDMLWEWCRSASKRLATVPGQAGKTAPLTTTKALSKLQSGFLKQRRARHENPFRG